MEHNEKPLDTTTLSDEALIRLYNSIPHSPASGVYYHDFIKHDEMNVSARTIVLECARRFVLKGALSVGRTA